MIRQKFLNTIHTHGLIAPRDRVLIAVSGGADSIALLRLLLEIQSEWQLHLEIAHMNHRLRGDDADRDAEFVRKLAWQYQLQSHLKNCDINKIAESAGQSIEAVGRVERYRYFQKVARARQLHKIATAHHANDQAESILFNLLRGTGYLGLAGIAYQRDNVIRPLLDIKKEEILSYLHEIKQDFCHDDTNENSDHTRNRIRHHLLPILAAEYNPNIRQTLTNLAHLFRLYADFLNSEIEPLLGKCLHQQSPGEINLDLSNFFNYPELIQLELIRAAISRIRTNPNDYTMRHYQSIRDLAGRDQPSGELHLPHQTIVRKDHRSLYLGGKPATPKPFQLGLKIPGKIRLHDRNKEIVAEIVDFVPGLLAQIDEREVILLDPLVEKENLIIRSRQPGDRILMANVGRRKLKDVLIDEKISRYKRDGIPLLVVNDRLVWIIGHRRSADWLVPTDAHNCVKLTFQSIK